MSPGLSAGRVQSCGLHCIVKRERLRWGFTESKYYSITANLEGKVEGTKGPESGHYEAKLVSLDGRKVAGSGDFDDKSGMIKGAESSPSPSPESNAKDQNDHIGSGSGDTEVQSTSKKAGKKALPLVVLDEEKATAVLSWLSGQDPTNPNPDSDSSQSAPDFEIRNVEVRNQSRKPPAAFITSTLQQEGSRKLGMSPARTMAVAQGLYERGFITYMRTDSPLLSTVGTEAAQMMVGESFGEEFVATAGSSKKGKEGEKGKEGKEGKNKNNTPLNAQEAHEAIRPVIKASGRFQYPDGLGDMEEDAKKLYTLIFRRTLASIMAHSESLRTTYTIFVTRGEEEGEGEGEGEAGEPPYRHAEFRSSETIVTFKGFLLALDPTYTSKTAGIKRVFMHLLLFQ